MIDMIETGKHLKEACVKSGYNCKQIAEKMYITESSLYHWFKGERMPTLDNIVMLADITGVGIESLIVKEVR